MKQIDFLLVSTLKLAASASECLIGGVVPRGWQKVQIGRRSQTIRKLTFLFIRQIRKMPLSPGQTYRGDTRREGIPKMKMNEIDFVFSRCVFLDGIEGSHPMSQNIDLSVSAILTLFFRRLLFLCHAQSLVRCSPEGFLSTIHMMNAMLYRSFAESLTTL